MYGLNADGTYPKLQSLNLHGQDFEMLVAAVFWKKKTSSHCETPGNSTWLPVKLLKTCHKGKSSCPFQAIVFSILVEISKVDIRPESPNSFRETFCKVTGAFNMAAEMRL